MAYAEEAFVTGVLRRVKRERVIFCTCAALFARPRLLAVAPARRYLTMCIIGERIFLDFTSRLKMVSTDLKRLTKSLSRPSMHTTSRQRSTTFEQSCELIGKTRLGDNMLYKHRHGRYLIRTAPGWGPAGKIEHS